MNSERYLEQVLELQNLDDGSDELKALQRHRNDVETMLDTAFPRARPIYRYGGSRAKGTMNRESYDLDLLCYFANDDDEVGTTLKEIFYNVASVLTQSYQLEYKSSALRLKSAVSQSRGLDFHIDVVPGRFTGSDCDDVFLFVSDGEKERLKTNLQKHIDHIRGSGLQETIRLAKLWNVRRGLRIKTFVLELLVVKALDGQSEDDLGLSGTLTTFWSYLESQRNSLNVEDPANPYGNDLSDVLEQFKDRLCDGASQTLREIEDFGWETLFGPAQKLSDAEKIQAIGRAVSVIHTPTKPWAMRSTVSGI